MKNIFDKIIVDVTGYIAGITNLQNIESIFEMYKLMETVLVTKKITVHTNTQILTVNNVPPNFLFTPGKLYEYALYRVPVVGDQRIINSLFSSSQRINGIVFNNNFFEYKEYSQTNIIGNDNEIQRIKDNCKSEFDAIQLKIEESNNAISNFNQNILLPYINETSENEKKSRKTKDESLLKLKW